MPPVSRKEIVSGLARLGLPGQTQTPKVLVHSSLSSFGYVEGGADTVIDALLDAVGPGGTVLVPTLTGNETLSPANPPVFDPAHTPCWTGAIPEAFRKRPDAVRSEHPTHSVAAIGPQAAELTRGHSLSITPCDEMSPYGRLAGYGDSFVLLLGVSHQSSTLFHYIEEMAGVDYHIQAGFAKATIAIGGQETHRHVMLHKYGTPRCFNIMEPIFVERGIQRAGQIGQATVRLVHVQGMVRTTLRCLAANLRILCRPDPEQDGG